MPNHADLNILLRSRSTKQIVVGKRLKTGSFANRQTSALPRIGMNESVAILRHMAGNRGGGPLPNLNSKPIGKKSMSVQGQADVLVFRQ